MGATGANSERANGTDLPLVELIAGARPNFMKIAPVLRALEAARRFATRIVHTGQHYDDEMSGVFLRDLGIREPDVSLGVGSGSHGRQTARILEAYEEHLMSASPPPVVVVVVGDVNSTAACTLAAVKLGIPVAHVEAGLRSFDRSMPEEINRVITDALADLLLVSEPAGEENLRREGISEDRICYVGNVMIDTLVRELPAARKTDAAKAHGVVPGEFAYVTLHRPSNVDDPRRLAATMGFLERLAGRLPVVFPVHPRTRARLEAARLDARLAATAGMRACMPLSYRHSLGLMSAAKMVITDSGGVQEETTFLDVPCITLRPNTERPVTERLGTNTVVGSDLKRAWTVVEEILAGHTRKAQPVAGWDGRAAERIAEGLAARYANRPR